MRRTFNFRLFACLSILNLSACGDMATLPEQAGIGPHPTLPPPHPTLLPTVNIASPNGWATGMTPKAGAGLKVNAFSTNLDHPRWLYPLPNGDVLVAETNTPAKSEDSQGIKSWLMKRL